jgi:hypothetical protein
MVGYEMKSQLVKLDSGARRTFSHRGPSIDPTLDQRVLRPFGYPAL